MAGARLSETLSRPSDEATAEQLELARKQGGALQMAVDEMTRHEAHGEERRAGDYIVGCAVEKAEGLYQAGESGLRWMEPDEENAHIEISVRDGLDGRFIPGLNIEVCVLDENGKEMGTHQHPFLWHPWLHHYGRNWKLPGSGKYTLRVRIEPPAFPRHDKINGRRYTEPVEIEFPAVHIETGQKK